MPTDHPRAVPRALDNEPARRLAPRETEIWAAVEQLREVVVAPPLRIRAALEPIGIFSPKSPNAALDQAADVLLFEIREGGLTHVLAFELAAVLVFMRLRDKELEGHSPNVTSELGALGEFLCEKNLAYGNSAHDPVKVFSDLPPGAQMLARMDDKISRLSRGIGNTEDSVLDLLGYLVLWLMGDSPREEGR